MIGLILGSFFVGYILSQIPGGFLAAKYGGKILFGGAMLFSGILTMLTPVVAIQSAYLLITLRVCLGVFQVQFKTLINLCDCLHETGYSG